MYIITIIFSILIRFQKPQIESVSHIIKFNRKTYNTILILQISIGREKLAKCIKQRSSKTETCVSKTSSEILSWKGNHANLYSSLFSFNKLLRRHRRQKLSPFFSFSFACSFISVLLPHYVHYNIPLSSTRRYIWHFRAEKATGEGKTQRENIMYVHNSIHFIHKLCKYICCRACK